MGALPDSFAPRIHPLARRGMESRSLRKQAPAGHSDVVPENRVWRPAQMVLNRLPLGSIVDGARCAGFPIWFRVPLSDNQSLAVLIQLGSDASSRRRCRRVFVPMWPLFVIPYPSFTPCADWPEYRFFSFSCPQGASSRPFGAGSRSTSRPPAKAGTSQ